MAMESGVAHARCVCVVFCWGEALVWLLEARVSSFGLLYNLEDPLVNRKTTILGGVLI